MQTQNDAPIGRLSALNQEVALREWTAVRLFWRDEMYFQRNVSGAASSKFRLWVENIHYGA